MPAGDGRSRANRLDLPALNGAHDEPVTYGKLREMVKDIQLWADRLEFGYYGFKVYAGVSGYSAVLVELVETVFQFGIVERDSSNFTLADFVDPLEYFQVPLGGGGSYNITWNFEFYNVVTTSTTYNVILAEQTLVVPADVRTMTVDASGGSGRNRSTSNGGRGARVQATIPTTPGQTLSIRVGQCNTNLTGGYFGGGNGGNNVSDGGSGGGASIVKVQGALDSASLVVAGGGGGAGYTNGSWFVHGGDAGFPAGEPGEQGGVIAALGWTVAGGGTQSAGGAPSRDTAPANRATPGAAFSGGNAGAAPILGPSGGGGGGGYYGGGGGFSANMNNANASGGGGSSYTAPSVTGVTHTAPFTADATSGQVIIAYTTENQIAAGVLVVRVYVARYTYLDYAPYEYIELVSMDRGYNPLHGAVNVPLGENDRVYMTYLLDDIDTSVQVKNATTNLSVIRNGVE